MVFFLLGHLPKGMDTLATISGYETLLWNNLEVEMYQLKDMLKKPDV